MKIVARLHKAQNTRKPKPKDCRASISVGPYAQMGGL